jgi:antitoxin ParD1/3/4
MAGETGQGFLASRAHSLKRDRLSYIFDPVISASPETAMNVKISIELTDNQAEFVERLVRDGSYGSVSEIMQEHVRDMMLSERDKGNEDDPVTAMKDEIRRRLELPDDQWIRMDEHDTMFKDLRAHIKQQIESGK